MQSSSRALLMMRTPIDTKPEMSRDSSWSGVKGDLWREVATTPAAANGGTKTAHMRWQTMPSRKRSEAAHEGSTSGERGLRDPRRHKASNNMRTTVKVPLDQRKQRQQQQRAHQGRGDPERRQGEAAAAAAASADAHHSH